MITVTVCMDCTATIRFSSEIGSWRWNLSRFDVSHGLCDRCRDKRMAELNGLKLERDDTARRLARLLEVTEELTGRSIT